ncbi:DnaJ domain-containing protein [Coemansia biformis]|uniref:DnaJ domain-containing protein n=1 Tax=Coemansia biformis TaxID=1286918 RepID=A0A9W8CXJ8_9FUNG|nr:DnaJ domain-containing protein [Coemansia biformis]
MGDEIEASADAQLQKRRQDEVERVLRHSTLDPFGILGVAQACTPDDVKAAYRAKSRLIHPDKTDHAQARDAFERLKQAESELMDDEKRTSIRAMMGEARRELLAERQKQAAQDGGPAAGEGSAEFEAAVLAKYKSIMVDIEWRRRQKLKQQMAAEGRAAAREEEAALERRQRRDADKAWEDTRDDRVNSWRSFQSKAKSKGAAKRKKPAPY